MRVKGMEVKTSDPAADLQNISDTLVSTIILMNNVAVDVSPEGYAELVDSLDGFVTRLVSRLTLRGSKTEMTLLKDCLDTLKRARTARERCRGIHRFTHVMGCYVQSAVVDTKAYIRADGNKTRRKMDSGSHEVRENDVRPTEDRKLLDTVDRRLQKQKESADAAQKQGRQFYKKTVRSICKNVLEEAVIAGKRISFKSVDQLRTSYYNDAPRFGYFLETKRRRER